MRLASKVSLRVRLTAWYTVALVVVLGLGAADVLWVQGRLGLRRVDRELDAVAVTIANVIRAELAENASVREAAEEALHTVEVPGRAIAILDDRGQALAATWSRLTLPAGSLPAIDTSSARALTVDATSGAWRVHVRDGVFGRSRIRLVAASPLTDVRREQREAKEAILVGLPIALLLAAAGGLWLATIGLRPITQMAQQAGGLPPTGTESLAGSERADEIGQLSRAFNGLLARLRAALRTQRQFMADASHELRTPVSVVRAAVDVALSRETRSEAEYRDTLAIIGSEADRLGRLVADMLVLARADAGGYPLRPVDLYLDEVVADCRRAVDVVAHERGVTIESGACPEVPFRGDEDLLRQLVLNVLQNAVQHTPSGGTVTIDLTQDDSHIAIRVSDSGSGIPPADRERIFDRFVQLDAARRGTGTGLGLPIARWIAEAHQGSLVLEESGPHGSRFCVNLRTAAASA